MAKSERKGWDYLLLYIVLLFLAGIGICVGGHYFPNPSGREITTGIGTAIIVAAVLAGTIDQYFKRRLLEDAFKAVFGYVLPEYFREELNRIARSVFITNRAKLQLDIKKIDEDQVETTWSVDRELENISDQTQIFEFKIGLDDFGFPNRHSKILDCKMRLPDGPDRIHSVMKIGAHSNPDRTAKLESEIECVRIPASGRFSVYQKVSEIHRSNGTSYWIFFQPCRNPEIMINAPGLEYLVEFLHPKTTKKELAPHKYSLEGTFLPYQPVIVRWWPKGFNAKEHGVKIGSTQASA